MKKLFLLAFLCQQALFMSAEIVTGRVVDSESNEPLEGAQVKFTQVEGNNWYIYDITTDSCGMLEVNTGKFMSRVNLTVNYFGYQELQVKDFMVTGGNDTINLGDLKLKMSPELLKEVTVKGKARQFYMKGDTVIFNPEAFNLETGDRVEALLRKLPGVRIENGVITFNGKPVHMKMNGHDIVDDFLTGQLPVEAVQNVKAYERKSEKAELTGVNDGQEQQILDIIIKPGFLDKWYGQTKTSIYTSANYRASGNLHYLSEHNPIGVYARISDNGSKTGSVYDNGEWDHDNSIPQRQQYGKLSFQHSWKPKFVESSYEDKWWFSSSPQHLDTHQNSWSNTEMFLSGQPSDFSNSHFYNYNHGLDIPMEFGGYLHFNPRTYIDFSVNGSFRKSESSSKSESKTYRGTEYSDTPQQMVNSTTSDNLSHSDNLSIVSQATLHHILLRGDFYVSSTVSYVHDKGHSDSHSLYDYHQLGTSETLLQKSNNKSNLFQTIFDTKLNYELIEHKVELGIGYWIDYWHKADNSHNYRNDVFDHANSFDRMKSYFVNEPRVEINADLNKLWMMARVKLQYVEERFEYQRGKLDTIVQHNTWFPRPMVQFKLKTTKTTELSGGASWEYHVADLLDGLDYTDDTNPLNIVKGNPNLKPNSDLNSDLSYRMMFPKGQQMLSWTLRYSRAFDPVAGVNTYDATTGVYTSTKTNVDDRHNWSAGINYDRSLGNYLRMRSSFNYGHTLDHGIKTMTSPTDILEQFRQNVSNLYANMRISYEDNGWELSASGTCSFNSVTYSDPSVSSQHLWNYNAGLSGIYRKKHWTFNLKGELVGNTGYISDIMNRNRFSLDAGVTWKILNSRGQFTLSAKDILNEMDNVYNNISPTMRYESRSETFHRYLSLTFTYNFDAKAKK